MDTPETTAALKAALKAAGPYRPRATLRADVDALAADTARALRRRWVGDGADFMRAILACARARFSDDDHQGEVISALIVACEGRIPGLVRTGWLSSDVLAWAWRPRRTRSQVLAALGAPGDRPRR